MKVRNATQEEVTFVSSLDALIKETKKVEVGQLSEKVLRDVVAFGSGWYLEPFQTQAMARELLELRKEVVYLKTQLMTKQELLEQQRG